MSIVRTALPAARRVSSRVAPAVFSAVVTAAPARRLSTQPLQQRQQQQQNSSSTSSSYSRWLIAAGGLTLSSLLLNEQRKNNIAEAAGNDDNKVDFAAVRQDIVKLLDEDDNRGPLFIRLAWHASGTYDKASHTGGSNGATMRYQPEAGFGANAGLGVARTFLEQVKKNHPNISFADLWTLSAVVAVEYMGGPAIPWKAGRTDAPSRTACPPDGRLPDADKGASHHTIQHMRDIFNRMGFDDREIVALAGAHSLGRCHADRSGYEGPWTRSPTTFSNEYFRELLENKWTVKKWDGPQQYEDPTGELMMLPADLAFVQDEKFKQYVELYAKDQKVFFEDFSKAFSKMLELGVPFKA